MALLTVQVSADLVDQYLGVGDCWPRLLVEQGLPRDARPIGAALDNGTVVLRFESPTVGEDREQPIRG